MNDLDFALIVVKTMFAYGEHLLPLSLLFLPLSVPDSIIAIHLLSQDNFVIPILRITRI